MRAIFAIVLACSLASCLEPGFEPVDCAFPGEGCSCAASAPIPCHERVESGADGLICRSGVRVCEGGRWSACQDGTTYRLENVMGGSAALIESEQACYDCNPGCRQVTGEPEGSDGTGTTDAPGGGITLEPPAGPRSCSPDTDGDRVPDVADDCVDAAGRPEFLGCGSGDPAVLAILPSQPRRFSVTADLIVQRDSSSVAAELSGAYPSLLVNARPLEVVSGRCRSQNANTFRDCDASTRVRFRLTLANDGVIAQGADPQVFDHQVALDDGRSSIPQGTVRVLVPADGCVTSGAVGMDGIGVILPPGVDGPCGDLVDGDGDSMPDIVDACPTEVGAPDLAGCVSGTERVTAVLPFGSAVDGVFIGTTLASATSQVTFEVSGDPGFLSGWSAVAPTTGFCVSTRADSFEGCDAGTAVGFAVGFRGVVMPSARPQVFTFEVDVVSEVTTSRPRTTERHTIEVSVVVPATGCDATGAFGTDGFGGLSGVPGGPPTMGDACEAMADRDGDQISDVADDCADLAGQPELRGCASGAPSIVAYLPPSLPVSVPLSYVFPDSRSTYREVTFEVEGDPALAFDITEVIEAVDTDSVNGHCAGQSGDAFTNCSRNTEVTFNVRFRNTTVPATDVPRVFDFAINLLRYDSRSSSPVSTRVPVRVVVPPIGCSLTGGYGNQGSGGTGDGHLDVVPAHCPASGCACSNGLDDDGDGLIDGADPECTGPADNDEGTFGTGIPGDNRDPFWQDCFFDGNSGAGDDGCRYHTECVTGVRPPTDPSCTVTDSCRTFCAPLAPNGCDCFGCCAVERDSGATTHVVISDTCSMDVIDDPTRCTICTPDTECVNECGRCELCMGKTIDELPADCGGPECGTGATCASDAGCGDGEICLLGCCSSTGGVCAAADFSATPIPPNFVIVMDQSGSMDWSWAGGGSRWDGMKSALFDPADGVITNLQGDVRFAMRTYREQRDLCDDVLIGESTLRLMARDALSAFINGESPDGGTPTADAVEQTTAWLVGHRTAGTLPTGPTAIILATDGEPNGCSGSANYGRDAVVDRVTTAFGAGFPTFVVAIDRDIAPDHLQDVANAGAGLGAGGSAPYFTVTSIAELRTSLTDLITSRLSCALDMSGAIDVAQGACGGGSLALDGVPVPCSADDGWVAVTESQIEMRGTWCDALLANPDAVVAATFPCPLPVDPCDTVSCDGSMVCELGACVCPPHTYLEGGVCVEPPPPMGTFTSVYDAAELCMIPPERPRWTDFMWEATIPAGSQLIIGVRSAETLVALDRATFESRTITEHTTGPGITCPPRDGVAPTYCAFDVGQLLSDGGMAHGVFLEVSVTLVAASAEPVTYPVVSTIRQEAFCAPVE